MLASQGHFYPPDAGHSETARLAWAACSAIFMNRSGRRLPIPVPTNVRPPPAVAPLKTGGWFGAAFPAIFINGSGRSLPIPAPTNVRPPPAVAPLPTRARIVAADLHSVTRPLYDRRHSVQGRSEERRVG